MPLRVELLLSLIWGEISVSIPPTTQFPIQSERLEVRVVPIPPPPRPLFCRMDSLTRVTRISFGKSLEGLSFPRTGPSPQSGPR